MGNDAIKISSKMSEILHSMQYGLHIQISWHIAERQCLREKFTIHTLYGFNAYNLKMGNDVFKISSKGV